MFSRTIKLSFSVVQLPGNDLAYTNALYANPKDFKALNPHKSDPVYVQINGGMVFILKSHKKIEEGSLGVSRIQRQACRISQSKGVVASPYSIPENENLNLINLRFTVDVFRGNATVEEDDVVQFVLKNMRDQVFCIGAQFVYDYNGSPLKLTVSTLQVANVEEKDDDIGKNVEKGIITSFTSVSLLSGVPSKVKINKSTSNAPGLVGPEWKYSDMGIGGLDAEFANIFRRAFASRTLPPKAVEQLGIEHVRGLLLHGPPGTGKTLIARQIGKMLNGREPKVVNGPEILNKYVGASEENIRNLFVDAEDDQNANGVNAELHIIIFDEIDAICKQRGSNTGGTGVHDTVVNQLLSKMDGVESLNNILVIGMTNRKDMIDEALLRPGRFEAHIEIGLPDQAGRVQILKIHTRKMRENGYLSTDVDFDVLSEKTKNYSGAEIAGLVRSAQAFALYGKVDVHDMEHIGVKEEDLPNMKIEMAAFEQALQEVRPAFGSDKDSLQTYVGQEIIHFGSTFEHVYNTCISVISEVRNGQAPLRSILLEGRIGTGKTALAAQLAIESDFPFAKMISPEDFVGYSESAKCAKISKIFDDAYKSPLSLIILDNIERLLGYVSIGPRFSNQALQTLLVLVQKVPPRDERTKEHRKLLIIGTTSSRDMMDDMGLLSAFNIELHCPQITKSSDFEAVFKASGASISPEDLKLLSEGFTVPIGVKQLLMAIQIAAQRGEGRVTHDEFMRCTDDLGILHKY